MDGMFWLYAVVMVIALIGMIACSKKQRTNPAMQPVAFVLFIVVVVCGIMLMKDQFSGSSASSSVIKQETAFYASQGYKVGDYFKATIPGQKVLVIAEPGFENNQQLQKLIDSFKEGYGSENVVVDTVTLPPGTEELQQPLYVTMKAKELDELIEKHSDAKILLNLIGLPEDSRRLKFWNGSDHPAMVLINFQSGVVNNLPSLIQKGQITGIVIPSRDAKYDVPVPGDPLEAFKIRFVLVDKDNVNEYKDQLMI